MAMARSLPVSRCASCRGPQGPGPGSERRERGSPARASTLRTRRRHHVRSVAGDEVPGPGHAHELAAGDGRRDGRRDRRGHHQVPGARDHRRGCPDRAQRRFHVSDLAYEGALLGQEAPPHLPGRLHRRAVAALVGEAGAQPLEGGAVTGPHEVAHPGQQSAHGEQARRAQHLAHHGPGQQVVQGVQAGGAPDRPHEHEAGHELGAARRQLDGHSASVAVAHHRDRGHVASGDHLGQQLGVAGDAECLLPAAAVAGAVHDEHTVVLEPLGHRVPVAAQPGLAVDEEDGVAPAPVNDERWAQGLPRRRGRRRADDRPPVSADAAGSPASAGGRRRGRVSGSRTGISTVNTAPSPGALSTRAVPPCAAARAATIDIPSPVPSPVRAWLPR